MNTKHDGCRNSVGRSSIALLFSLAAVANAASLAAEEMSDRVSRWWPVQKMPKSVVELDESSFKSPFASYRMMAESVAGLAAKAVNEERSDELIWIGNGHAKDDEWFKPLQTRHPRLQTTSVANIWQLIEAYAKRGIIKGYVLYRSDSSKGDINEHRLGMDCSVNVATSVAGIVDGIIVDEALERTAQAHGLTKLLDARDKSQSWCFEKYRDHFTRRILCTQDPKKPHVRDLAIAQRAFTMYGNDDTINAVMKWLEPLSQILGWNGGDEFKTTEISSRW